MVENGSFNAEDVIISSTTGSTWEWVVIYDSTINYPLYSIDDGEWLEVEIKQ